MNMDDMIKLGMRLGVTISSHAVVEMEREILWKLKWNIFPPTAFCFAHHMISLFPREVPKSPTRYIMQELTKYMTELAVCKCQWIQLLYVNSCGPFPLFMFYLFIVLLLFGQVCTTSSNSRFRQRVLRRVWSPWIGMFLSTHLKPPCSRYLNLSLSPSQPHSPSSSYESLDDDCLITPEAKNIFLTRIYDSFGLRHDDEEILTLTGELQALLCHNTDLKGE